VARRGVSADQQGRAAITEYRDNQTIRHNEDNGDSNLRPFRQITKAGRSPVPVTIRNIHVAAFDY
jgi:hypothetical protein